MNRLLTLAALLLSISTMLAQYTAPQIAIIQFATDTIDFDTVTTGENITREFTFTNTGTQPLLIRNVVPRGPNSLIEFTPHPIMNGENGSVKITLYTGGKHGSVYKPFRVESNNVDGDVLLILKGFIEAKMSKNDCPKKSSGSAPCSKGQYPHRNLTGFRKLKFSSSSFSQANPSNLCFGVVPNPQYVTDHIQPNKLRKTLHTASLATIDLSLINTQIMHADGAVMSFNSSTIDFGTAVSGEVIIREFIFINTGTQKLVINAVQSTCACAVADFETTPYAPGDTGIIRIRYSTTAQYGFHIRTFVVKSNQAGGEILLHLKGKLIPASAAPKNLAMQNSPQVKYPSRLPGLCRSTILRAKPKL